MGLLHRKQAIPCDNTYYLLNMYINRILPCKPIKVITIQAQKHIQLQYFSFHLQKFVNGSLKVDHLQQTGQMVDLFNGECCVPETVKDDAFVIQYGITISNDGTVFGSGETVTQFDSTCQEYTGDNAGGVRQYSLKVGFRSKKQTRFNKAGNMKDNEVLSISITSKRGLHFLGLPA